jgi:hypothetical protein
MRWTWVLVAVALAGCGEKKAARATSTPTATPAEATATSTPTPTGPWQVRETSRAPLRCPASSSRAGWPSRVLALGGNRYAKLWGRRPRLAAVDARGHLLGQQELGARRTTSVRALACGRGGRIAAAWTEYRGHGRDALRLSVSAGRARTIDTARAPYYDPAIQDVALAFAPDGSLLIAYSVDHAVRGVVVSRAGAVGAPFELGPASQISLLAAEIAGNGRAVVAWSTLDGGEERNEHRRIYAVTGRDGRFGPAQLVHRAPHLSFQASSYGPIRLAVAANGRALLLWGTDSRAEFPESWVLRTAEAPPDGPFGASRQVVSSGTPGDVAIRGDGRRLLVWTNSAGLRASVGRRREVVVDGRTGDPRASFRAGKPHVEWGGGAASRR